MQQIHISIIVLATLIALVFFSFLITKVPSNNTSVLVNVFQQQDSISKIKDDENDTKLVALHKAIVPEVQGYHDILAAEVNKINDNKILFTIELAGDGNTNEKYETVYIWLIYISTTDGNNGASPLDKEFQLYTIIIPNFGANSNFGNKESGWYLAIFNNTNNVYTLPLSKISDMPTNKVQVFIDPIFIGNPSNFNYLVSSMIRVNNTFLDKSPDCFVDFAPDSFKLFWKPWFR